MVAIGRDMERRLVALGTDPARIEVIPNWADGAAIRPLEEPSRLRRERGWDDRFVVMHSGNVGLSQELGTLLAAADLLREEPDVVVAIVGDGASKAGLQAEAAERGLTNVEFLALPAQGASSPTPSGAADLHVVGLRRGLAGYIVPSKVYGILAAGRPYVAGVERGAEPALIAEEHACGVRVEPERSGGARRRHHAGQAGGRPDHGRERSSGARTALRSSDRDGRVPPTARRRQRVTTLGRRAEP